jgi:hypothetical protein
MVPVDRIAHRRGQAIPPVLDPLHWVVCCPTHDGRGDERAPVLERLSVRADGVLPSRWRRSRSRFWIRSGCALRELPRHGV